MTFQILEKIGSGRFGEIFKVKDSEGSTYAFKNVPANKLKYIELDILMRLKSPYIIRTFKPYAIDIEGRMGFLENLKDTSIDNLNTMELPYTQLKRLIMSIIYGLQCMHRKNFLHLDISRSNILYDTDKSGNYTAYLSDFGWSVRCDNPYKGIVADKVIKYKNTPLEILRAYNDSDSIVYSDKSDMWSCGITIMEMIGDRFRMDENFLNRMSTIDVSYIEERIRIYNQDKMSAEEEVKLKELLVHLLKIDKDERISSEDIDKLNFMQNNLIKYDCALEKPKENIYLLYTSPRSKDGIHHIKSYYENNKLPIYEYFQAIQVFLFFMSRSNPYLSNDELMEIIEDTINVVKNYNSHNIEANGRYNDVKKLGLNLGYNYYFYADYLQDLVILNHYILNGDENLLGYYNVLNIKKIFSFFREKFDYDLSKKRDYTTDNFFEEKMPEMKSSDTVDFLKAVDYHNISEEREEISHISKIKEVEKDFRSDILDHFQEKIIDTYVNEHKDLISIVDKMSENKNYIDKVDKLKETLLSKNMEKYLQNITQNFKYGIIYMDYYGNITTEDNLEDYDYFIIKKNKRTSLVYISQKEKNATHYYSDHTDTLAQYFQLKNYKFSNNFKYGINTCCKIIEICIIFIIYYNIKLNTKDFNIKCIDKNTIKSILVVLAI